MPDHPQPKVLRSIQVISIDQAGFVRRYDSIADAARALGSFKARGHITNALKGKAGARTAFGLRWMLAEDFDAGMSPPSLETANLRRPIVLIDASGNRDWVPTAAEAARRVGISDGALSKALDSENVIRRRGMLLFYVDRPPSASDLAATKTRREGRARAVVCVDTNETFRTVEDAAARVGRTRQAIINVCAGRAKSCAGFRWRYAERASNILNED